MEDFDLMIAFPAGFPLRELYAVSSLLADSGICVPGYIPPEVGLYDPEGFWYGQHVDGLKTILLPDRNVASRFAQLPQGRVVSSNEQLRVAAALMAFAQCLDIEIEPSIAFHELAHQSGNLVACNELAWFRIADNASPQDLIAVALGKRDRLTCTHLPLAAEKFDLAKPLRRWKRNYVIALKIMELRQAPMPAVERVIRILEWMRADFIFGGPAALLACVFLAPKSPPKRRLFKNQNSSDREAALAGVKNEAWDLTHLSDFIERVNANGNEGRARYLFASFDKKLRQIASLAVNRDESLHKSLLGTLTQWWSEPDAIRLVDAIDAELVRIRDPRWKPKEAPRPDYVDWLIEEGERLIRQQ